MLARTAWDFYFDRADRKALIDRLRTRGNCPAEEVLLAGQQWRAGLGVGRSHGRQHYKGPTRAVAMHDRRHHGAETSSSKVAGYQTRTIIIHYSAARRRSDG